MNKQDVLDAGFVPYTGTDYNSGDLYIKPINGLGWNLGIDILNKECFYFECNRPTAFPYPIPARIITKFKYPPSIDELNRIFNSIL
jgi:hypothetical protein